MERLRNHLFKPVDSASIAVFRMALGFLVPLELLHYYFFRPFISELYLRPEFHFKYPLFDWVPDLYGNAMGIVIVLVGLSFVMMGLGLFYRITRWTSFLGITYLFLVERASFLNHWYLVVLLCFLLLFIPANGLWSLDARRNPTLRRDWLPAWCLYLPLALLSIVYFYSGLVKIQPDWLDGLQMKVYLTEAFGEIPEYWAYLAAYGTLLLELVMVPLLLWRRTRAVTFVLTVMFHVNNSYVFTLGLFPFMMIALTTLYLAPDWPRVLLQRIWPKRDWGPELPKPERMAVAGKFGFGAALLGVFFALQLLLPFRSLLYKGNQLWTEEGLICSWKMMLEAKTNAIPGALEYWVYREDWQAPLRVIPKENGLTWAQENKVVRNPDLILQYAHHLGQQHTSTVGLRPQVYVDAFLGLNGREIQRFIHPNVDLFAEPRRILRPYPWVMPIFE